MVVFMLLLVLANAAALILTGCIRFLIAALLFAVFLGVHLCDKKDPQPQKKTHALLMLIPPFVISGFLMLFAPFFHSGRLWRYPFQRAFHGIYNSTPKWIPDFSGDVQSDYYFDAMPTIMQGTGHYSVRFVTAPERAAEIEKQFAAQAQFIADLPDTHSHMIAVPEPEQKKIPDKNEEWDGIAHFYCDEAFWYPEGNPLAGTRICILDLHGNWNHPGSSAVIVNSRTGAVEYSQFGWTQLAYGE